MAGQPLNSGASRPHPRLVAAGVLFAIVFPSVETWVYFIQAADSGADVQRAVMAALKCVQFLFPAVWVALVLRERLQLPQRTGAGVMTGLAFGAAVSIAGWLIYANWLADSAWFRAAAEPIQAKIAAFGLDSAGKFAALGLFYSLIHSLLEEYYWRWFVFGQLRRLMPLWPAIIISALGFMAHHVLVLSHFFGWWTGATLLLSAAVAIGGGFWAWLYARSGSLLGPWLSHALVDAGIFWIGYTMVSGSMMR